MLFDFKHGRFDEYGRALPVIESHAVQLSHRWLSIYRSDFENFGPPKLPSPHRTPLVTKKVPPIPPYAFDHKLSAPPLYDYELCQNFVYKCPFGPNVVTIDRFNQAFPPYAISCFLGA